MNKVNLNFLSVVVIPTLFLVLLKITGQFPYGWVWVFSPFWIWVVAIGVVVTVLIFSAGEGIDE